MSSSGFEGQGHDPRTPPDPAHGDKTPKRPHDVLRRDARGCLLAGVAAVDAEKLTLEALARLGGAFPAPARGPRCGPAPGPSSESTASSPILMAGFGKAALGMGRAAAAFFGGRIERGLLLIPHGSARGRSDGTPTARSAHPTLGPAIRIIEGGHPLPDTAGVAGAHAVHELALAAARTGIPLLCLVSGGGSALLTLPPEGVSLDDLRDLTRRLLHAGAGIAEVNCVRRHLDRLKGGRLALQAAPAPVIGLLLSDVIGDSPAAIASGPLSPDSTTFADAV
ncbi:MAG: glycerate-2-kinase family protein, partial [Candidatus Eisenbacteria bacterium]